MESPVRATWAQRQAPPPHPGPWYELHTIAAQMRDALGDEIRVATERRHRLVDLPEGSRQPAPRASSPFHYYAFPDVTRPARPGTKVHLRVGGRFLAAAVVPHHDPHTLLLAVAADLGPKIVDAQLDLGVVWLLAALRDCLRTLPRGFNADLALAAVGRHPVPPLGPDVEVTDLLPGIDLAFDLDKLQALRVALRAPVGCVWGPPGTGKTATLAALVEAQLIRDQRVLVLAPTNAATDEAALRITQRLEETRVRWGLAPALSPGRVIRYGYVDPRVTAGCHTPIEVTRLQQDTVRRANVLVTTLHQAYLRPELHDGWDVVVVDEAGAATLAQAFWAAGLAGRQVSYFGDFRQLGPVVLATTRAADQWLRRDVFMATGVAEAVQEDEMDPPYLGVLTTQFRMDRRISGLVGELFYGGRLTTSPELVRRPPLPCSVVRDAAITLIDTSGHATNQPSGTGRGRTNPCHAEVVKRLLAAMAGEIPMRRNCAGDSVAVLTPFRAQVALHRRTWRKQLPGKAVRASTVHTYQGGEVDTVVLDLTDAPGMELSRFMRAHCVTDAGARLLNVSVSRARFRVIILADVAWLSGQARNNSVLARFLTVLEERATRVALDDLF